MYRSRAIGDLSTTADHLPDLRERLQPERVFPQEGPRHPFAQLHLRQVSQKVPNNQLASLLVKLTAVQVPSPACEPSRPVESVQEEQGVLTAPRELICH